MTSEADALCEVVITAPDAAWLQEFTRDLVADGLAASVHQTEILTTYTWKGAQVTTMEARASLRTRRSCFDEIARRTQRDHPYEVPSVVATPITRASPGYGAWILKNTESSRQR